MKNNIGFIAIGQAGGNIGYLLEQKGFNVFYFNSSKGDLDTINTDSSKKYHINGGRGCAKDRNVAKSLIKGDFGNIFNLINERMKEEIIFLLFSSSGGTGSGSSPVLADILSSQFRDKKIGLITVLPSEQDTLQAHINAYECFMEISKLENIGTTFVIDNNSNNNIFSLNERFVSLFCKTLDFKRHETTKGNIDEAEIFKLFSTKGMSVLGHCKNTSTEDLIKSIKKGIFASLENDGKIKYLGLSLGIKFNYDIFQKEIGKYIDKFENTNSEYTLAFLSGLSLPFSRLKSLRDKIQSEQDIIKRNFNNDIENRLEGLDFLSDLVNKSEETVEEVITNDVNDIFAKYRSK